MLSFFSVRRTHVPLAALLLWLAASSCATKTQPDPPPAQPQSTKPAAASASSAAAPVSASEQPAAALSSPKDGSDYGCSSFYFLWGRHAELEGKHEAALDAYEKALICDPKADFVISKMPDILLRLNRSDDAAARLNEYLAHKPDDAAARMQLAKIFVSSGKLEEAAEQYRKANELNPKDSSALLLLSELHLAQNRHDLAKTALREVLAADSNSSAAHILLARLLAEEKNYSQAAEHYRKAIALSPSDDLRLELADTLMQQRQPGQAVKIYQELLEKDELNEEARISLIHAWLLMNNEKKAMAELDRLKELVGSAERAELTVAKLYIRWEELGKAATMLKKLLAKENISEARHLLGALQFQRKKYKDALKTLKKISPDDEEYEDALILQVRALRELKRQDEAMRMLETVLADSEQQFSPELWALLASLQQAAEQDEACGKTLTRALKAHPDDELLLYDYGLSLDRAGQKKQALKVMRKLIKINPNHAGALNYVGYIWAENKVNLSKAFLYLTKAKELLPDNAHIQDSLGWLHRQMGNLEEARKILEQAAAMPQADPLVLDHLAETYSAAGCKEKALTTWKKALKLHSGKKRAGEGKKAQLRRAREQKRIQEKIDRLENKKGKKK